MLIKFLFVIVAHSFSILDQLVVVLWSTVLRRLLRLSRKEGWDWLAMAALGQRGRGPIYSCIVSTVGGLRKRTGLRSSRKVSNRSHLEACSPRY